MLDFLKSLFMPDSLDTKSSENDLQIALCALLLEVAQADGSLERSEEERIDSLLGSYFKLAPERVQALKERAEISRRNMIDLYSFTKEIRQRCSPEEREKILEMVWMVVYADGYIDKYEESICRRLAELIGLNQKQYIATKLKILQSQGT